MRLGAEGPVQSDHCEREALAGTADRDEFILKTTGVKSNYYGWTSQAVETSQLHSLNRFWGKIPARMAGIGHLRVDEESP
jgi:hypothetical protein